MLHKATGSAARAPRLFIESDLAGGSLVIADRGAHYLGNVLRLRAASPVIVFNGRGRERLAKIELLSRRRAELRLYEDLTPLPEPALDVTLIQSLVKSDAMDLIVQKATELGVRAVYACKTDFSVIRLHDERAERRVEHWQRIAQSACEQSGRHVLPKIASFRSFADSCTGLAADALRIVLRPNAPGDLAKLRPQSPRICLFVGPEGGFSAADLEAIDAAGFAAAGLGPRVLRAETAAIAACTLAQFHWGDLH